MTALELVLAQAEDQDLWFTGLRSDMEIRLQAALRALHAAVEADAQMGCRVSEPGAVFPTDGPADDLPACNIDQGGEHDR